MANQFSQSFEHQALEADIRALAQEIQRHKELPENKSLNGKELLKQAIRALPPKNPNQTEPAGVPSQSSTKSPLPAYADNAPAEVKLEIEYLLDIAFHHGIIKADTEAKKSPPFVLDAFHDALAGKLYPELQRRGILK